MNKISIKQEQRRAEIIQAFRPLLAEHSFSDITVRDLCEAANISIGSFYHYFQDKDHVIYTMFQEIDTHLEDVYTHTQGSVNYRLQALLTAYLSFSANAGFEACRTTLRLNSNTKEENHMFSTRPFRRFVQTLVEEGQQNGELLNTHDSRLMADGLVVAARGWVFDWARNGGVYPLLECAKPSLHFLLEGMSQTKRCQNTPI